VVDWYERIQKQRGAFKEADPETILDFAKTIDAKFIVVPRTIKYISLEAFGEFDKSTTTKSIVLKVDK